MLPHAGEDEGDFLVLEIWDDLQREEFQYRDKNPVPRLIRHRIGFPL
jgi:hypothetical protein